MSYVGNKKPKAIILNVSWLYVHPDFVCPFLSCRVERASKIAHPQKIGCIEINLFSLAESVIFLKRNTKNENPLLDNKWSTSMLRSN